MTHKPAPQQKEIDFDRKVQLSLRREIDIPRSQKWLLWMLDDHIPSQNGTWTMSYADLAKETDMSVSTIRRAAAALKEKSLIGIEKASTRYHDNRMVFSICWVNIQEYISQDGLYRQSDTLEAIAPPCDESCHSEANRVTVKRIVSSCDDSTIRKNVTSDAPPNPHALDIEKQELKDPEKALAIASRLGLDVGPTNHDNRRRTLMSASLALRGENPPGLFVHLIRKGVRGDWSTLSDADHEPAKQELRRLETIDVSPADSEFRRRLESVMGIAEVMS